MFVGLLARGHCLLEGVPGIAKTLAVRTLATVTGGTFSRLQFTPDLVPGDIVGTRIWRPSTETFDVELGPVFATVVLADEINRAPAKVQSALLEAMAERQVSLGGRSHRLPAPFLVLATQNPIESDGVYELPEAQRDRFLLKIDLGYPSGTEELTILARMSVDPPVPRAGARPRTGCWRCSGAADQVFVHHACAEYAVRLVLATRDPAAHGLPDVVAGRCSSASARGPRSAWSPRPGRWPCCADAATCCPATSPTSRRRRASRTGWCSPSTRWPTAVDRRGRWWSGSSPRCAPPRVAARAGAADRAAGGGTTGPDSSRRAPSARCACRSSRSGAGSTGSCTATRLGRRPGPGGELADAPRLPARPGRRPAHGLERHAPGPASPHVRATHRRAGAGDAGCWWTARRAWTSAPP